MTEQEVIYVSFRDPDTLLPVLKFFNIAIPELSQDAVGLKEAIKNAFKEKNLESVLDKMVFLSSDGASVNSGKKSGLIHMFQEDYEWMFHVVLQSCARKNVQNTKRARKDENYVLKLPTLKSVVDEIKDDEDGKPTYQGQKVKRFAGKEFYQRSCSSHY